MIMLFGPAGSGKSSQGEILAERYGWKWLSVGDLLRELDDKAIDGQLVRGEMVDDNFVVEMMSRAIADADELALILDGFPRNAWQARWFVEHEKMDEVAGVLILDGDRDELRRRLEKRGRHDDSDEQVIRERFDYYDREMSKMLPVLEEAGVRVLRVDCIGTIPEVTDALVQALRELGVVGE